MDLEYIRNILAGKSGRQYWRSLEELADTDEFHEMLHREFPPYASAWDTTLDRRKFLKLMGASFALAGLSSCVKQPEEKIIPYVKQPEILIPGKPLHYATAAVLGGFATGIIVTSHMGRPTKIEGNPDHPASRGATDVFTQASILGLYDPDRSQIITHAGEISTWSKFLDDIQTAMGNQRALQGAGIRFLTETTSSPTLADQWQSFLRHFPKAIWHHYDPMNQDSEREGTRIAFGQYLDTQYRFNEADIVLSFAADVLGQCPPSVRYAHDFADRRRVRGSTASMNRLYVAESYPTITGMAADHRLATRLTDIEHLARSVARRLGVDGIPEADRPLKAQEEKWAAAAANDLKTHRGTSIVVAGKAAPRSVHALAHAMNHLLGNIGETVIYTDPVESHPENHMASLVDLANDIDAGKVDVLIIAGGNPVYNAPAELDIAQRFSKVKCAIRLGMYDDETSAVCLWHIPQSHYLESWSDARAFDGTITIQQPLIAPLYFSKSVHELMGELMGQSDIKGYDIVRNYWTKQHSDAGEQLWQRSLNAGIVEGTAFPAKTVDFDAGREAWQEAFHRSVAGSDALELEFNADPTIWDGQFANNAWLQELAKPMTKLTWDNAAYMSPATAQRLGLSDEDVVELRCDGRAVEAPVLVVPGHADGAITLHFGYGRRRAGSIGSGIGVNAFSLRTGSTLWHAPGVQIEKTGRRYPLARTQNHHMMEGRNQVRVGTVSEFLAQPSFAREMDPPPTAQQTLYPPHEYNGYAWGMSIDLNACIGCNACVIACQAENNIPVVGKDQVQKMREMQWIRIDSYFEGSPEDPKIHHQPVPCMHCENAPCELVCPVGATVHDSEGLNLMIYNRCVGTRYCSNNCPYKVRRFNFLEFNDITQPTLKMVKNPDVTVRSRGVMEKCTYCIQRISEARITAEKEDRPIRDGEVVTACQAACPTHAIVFGDTNNKASEVARLKAQPRDYSLLAELNTKPRTTYLAKLTNPNPDLGGGA